MATTTSVVSQPIENLHLIETDLSNSELQQLEMKEHERLTWFADFNLGANNTYLAVAFRDADGVKLIPKRDAYDLEYLMPNSTDIIDRPGAPTGLIQSHLSRLIDIGTVYDNYAVYDTLDDDDNKGILPYLSEALELATLRRNLEAAPIAQAKTRLLSRLGVAPGSKRRFGNKLNKRDREADCRNPTNWQPEQNGRTIPQERTLEDSSHHLHGYVDGQVFCHKDAEGPFINGYTMCCTQVCHTTVSKPVAYSIKIDNGSGGNRKIETWDRHGCRKGRSDTEKFNVASGNRNAIWNTHVYSWTVRQ